MPIRVNLKEIFPSDPQEINVDKVNFNFNKLLELGVGSPGPIGLTGPQGPAGPIGLVGPQGDRGATWWVDSGDPNTLTFTGLIDGDMYLDQTSNAFEVYRYDELTDTWNSVVSIAATVNAYLSTVTDSPFERSLAPSTNDQFVVFKDRTDSSDGVRGALNPSSNGILFLNNFDESLSISQDQYNSLLGIFATHDNLPLPSSKIDYGRYHFEFGSLYTNGTTTQVSELKHNLKGKFYKKYTAAPELPLTNEWINISKFSLSVPEGDSISTVDQNGEFEFVIPKYNNESSLITEEIYVRLGSAESFTEQTNRANILADGISITNNQVSRSMVIGLREDLGAVLDIPYSSSNFALFDVSDDVDGLFFNKTLIQTGGNFDQIITTGPVQLDLDQFPTATTTGHFMSQGIWIGSNTIWVSSGAGNTNNKSSVGQISKYDITNPKNPLRVETTTGDKGSPISFSGGASAIDQHSHIVSYNTGGAQQSFLGLVHDIAEYGKYVITAHSRGSGGNSYDIIIHETDSYINSTFRVGELIDSNIQDAYRVQIHGKYAWIITNRTWVTGPQTQGGANIPSARIASIDLTNPLSPTVADHFVEYYNADLGSVGQGTKYLDFDIFDGKAYVLRYTNYIATSTPPNSTHALDLIVFDIQDPTAFSALTTQGDFGSGLVTLDYSPQKTINLESLTVNTTRTEFGAIAVSGGHIYSVWEDTLYITKTSLNNISSVSTTQLSIESLNACDIKVYGNYAYILVNYTDSTGAVQIWDIRDITSPVMVAETRNANLATSSRLGISGKYIYVVSNSGTTSELITLDTTGIEAPSAQIGAVKTNNLQVSGNAHIKNNLQVKNSLNVGPGGIYVDAGQGISVDGIIKSTRGVDIKDTSDYLGDSYGVDYEFTGSSTGTVYGIRIKGSDANLLEGITTIDNVLSLTPGSAPLSPTRGMIYYDDSTNKLKLYTNAGWVNLN